MSQRAEQAHVEKLATLDLAIALYALQDCSPDNSLKLVTALTPLLAARTSLASQPGSKRRLDQSVCSCLTPSLSYYLRQQLSYNLLLGCI